MKVLGLDIGEKRIGVAKVDSDTRIAVPVGFITRDGSEWQEISRLMRLNGTNYLVLGLPRSNEGNETEQSVYVRNFAKILAEKIPEARLKFQDESLTSVIAEERLKKSGKKYERGDIDAEAAVVILEDFVEGGLESPFSDTLPSRPSLRGSGARSLPVGREWSEKEDSKTLKDPLEAANTIIKKEADKVKLRTKKITKWVSGGAILVILMFLVIGGIFWIKDKRARERAEYYAELEAQMEPEVFSFTIRPGETIAEVKKNLIEVGYTAEEVEAAFLADYEYEFLKGRPAGASLEGYLYGETFEFYKDATVEYILDVYLGEMGKVIIWNDLETKYAAQGLSLYEGITLASIIQKEAPSPNYNGEHATVAQVFLSRLDYGMRLGSDVTVSYAIDLVDPERKIYSDNAAALLIDSCYNTRLYAGLPCGPISNPGVSALLAVAEPADTSYLYFLTGDDGVMYYGSTEAEHDQNAREHCSEFCSISL